MLKKTKIILVLALFAVFCLATTVKSDYSDQSNAKEAWDQRNGADVGDWIEMGSGLVSENPDNEKAIQLTGGGQDSIPGMAASVYYFEPPAWAKAFRIIIKYYDESGDDEIAGRVFIKTNDDGSQPTSDSLFYGDTFILRASQNSEIIRVSAERYIMNGTIEVHVVASGQDQLTVESIEMEYLRETPEVKIVHEYHNDYWDDYPLYSYWYHYYYWSPHHYWPHGFHYVVWVIPVDYYWHTWRPWCRHHFSVWCGHHSRCWRRYADAYNDPPAHDRSAKIERRKRIHERLTTKEYTVRNKTDAEFQKKKYRTDEKKYRSDTRKYTTETLKKKERYSSKMRREDTKKTRRVIEKEKMRTEKEFRKSSDKREIRMESRSQLKERKESRSPRIEDKKYKQERSGVKYREKTERPVEKNYQSSRNRDSSVKSYKAHPPEKSSVKSQSSRESTRTKTEHKTKNSKRK